MSIIGGVVALLVIASSAYAILRSIRRASVALASVTASIVAASAALLVSIPAASQAVDLGQPPDNWPNNYAYNQSPIKREWPDGPNKSFLQNLQRPDNHKHPYRDKNSLTCCDAGDTVKTKFKVEPVIGPSTEERQYPEDRWYAWINGEWVLVPPDKIVPEHAPDGGAYLFMLAGTIQCFVRPKGGL